MKEIEGHVSEENEEKSGAEVDEWKEQETELEGKEKSGDEEMSEEGAPIYGDPTPLFSEIEENVCSTKPAYFLVLWSSRFSEFHTRRLRRVLCRP